MKIITQYIGHKIVMITGIVLFMSLLAVVMLYARQQEASILEQNENKMLVLSDTVSKGLQTVMLAGYADIAQKFAAALKKVQGIKTFNIMRISGQEAFLDNKTIEAVNKRIGEEEFLPRDEEKQVTIFKETHPRFKKVIDTQKTVSYYEQENGEGVLTFLVPILNENGCFRCHGSSNPVRGILKLTTSLEVVHRAIEESREKAWLVSGIAITASLLLIFALIRLTVVRPIYQVTQAMNAVAKGNYQSSVPVIGKDELSRMALNFNEMTNQVLISDQGLKQERNKLTTIILSAREAIVVTNEAGEVVLINPAAERILEKTETEIIDGGFLNIIDDAEYVYAFLERSGVGMPETLVYRERILNFFAATIKNHDGKAVGSAALIRDVTEEKKLLEQLRTMSFTDKLTGLNNRRRMEELLKVEYARAQRYSLFMSVLFFDVDHFKKFNDTYGHDMGDRVLEEMGKMARDHFRNVDFPCRYGGEEFCIILPNTETPGAVLAADRFRQRVEHTAIDGVHVTISIGVATFPTAQTKNEVELLKAADNALYQAKRSGRNRVLLWDPAMANTMEEKPVKDG